MANFNVTPNMNLPNPVPGVDPGPDYASNIQSSLNQIDQHNHSIGQGVLIQPNGLNINSDLPFNGNNAITLKTVRFLSQSSPIANSTPNVGCLYVSGNELWYNDFTGGNQVQITANGTINATSSGISNGTASAVFSAGTLVVKSSSTSFANVDLQSVVLSNSGNLTNQLTLLAPTLSGSYDITLPPLPASNLPVSIDASGNMTAAPIAQAQLAARATGTSVGAGGVAISASSGSFNTTSSPFVAVTNLSVTIVTTGRPVMLMLQSGSTSGGLVMDPTAGGGQLGFRYVRDASTVFQTFIGVIFSSGSANGVNVTNPVFLDVVTAGTHTYTVQVSTSGNGTILCSNQFLIAYEI
jgi:hypothetical protein